MARIKNVLEKAKSMTGKINPFYGISSIQIEEIRSGSRDWFCAINNGFKIGYMQGMKAAKAEFKKGGDIHD